jgi:hypothetical protein
MGLWIALQIRMGFSHLKIMNLNKKQITSFTNLGLSRTQLQTAFKHIGNKMTQLQALTKCLVLAITAPDDHKAQRASELAEQIARGLSVDQVEDCKAQALELVEAL